MHSSLSSLFYGLTDSVVSSMELSVANQSPYSPWLVVSDREREKKKKKGRGGGSHRSPSTGKVISHPPIPNSD